MGVAIPKTLPAATLACPPSENFIRNFIKDGGKGPISKGNPPHRFGDTAPAGFGRNKENKAHAEEGPHTDRAATAYASAKSGGSKQEKPQVGNDIWIKNHVDYSSKYGVGYLLSNGASGVFFNDSTKIVLDPN